MLTVGSLFSGIEGFGLGLERAGMRVRWQVEHDERCWPVLARRFPAAARFGDVRSVGAAELAPVHVVCGGFPCTDLSFAGKGAGLEGDQSSLWAEMFRIVGELRPRYVIVENVSALLVRGFERVLGDLASIGFDAEWDCLRASDFGAAHGRDRIWIVAYPNADGGGLTGGVQPDGKPAAWVEAQQRHDADRLREAVPDAAGFNGQARRGVGAGRGRRPQTPARGLPGDGAPAEWKPSNPWAAGEPVVDRMANGLPAQVDRLHALGNALVPQIAEWIGRRIIEWEEGRVAA